MLEPAADVAHRSPATTPRPRAGGRRGPVVDTGARSNASVVDHVGPPRHPYRVTVIRLARARETYEIRWREYARADDGSGVTRVKRTEHGGHSLAAAFAIAEKVWANLERSAGYHGAPPRPAGEKPATRTAKTLRQIAERWLSQHTGKPSTVEDYAAALDRHICAPVTFTDTRRARSSTHRVELGTMSVDEITEPDVRLWVNGMLQKPDARRKGETVLISSSSMSAYLRILTAVLNFAVAQGYLDTNPAATVSITIHGARQPEWFRTSDDFWAALAHIDERWDGALHDILVMLAYTGLRVNEAAGLRDTDPDLPHHRVMIRHNLDRKGRDSTVKTESSEDWMPLHPEAETALRHALDTRPPHAAARSLSGGPGGEPVFRGPRGGRIGSSLINDALTYGCAQAGLPYRVTVHGLRHSMANWLKTAGVPTRDIQAALRHADARTTSRYLHTSAEEKTRAINQLPGSPDPSARLASARRSMRHEFPA